MEDKTFELLTRIYSEFSSRFDCVEKNITDLKNDVAGLKNKVARIEIKLEHDIEPKIQVLFEDRDVIHSKLDSIEQKIDVLTSRVDKQDIQISVIKGGKPIASQG